MIELTEHVHFIGIGGTGLSAIAQVLLERGYRVSGSDQKYSPLAQAVEQAGAEVMVGHAADNVEGATLVIRSSAIPDDNVEVLAARRANLPVLKRADFLGQLMEGHFNVAVAGSHGKTTTTSMIACMLEALEQSPSFIVGGVVQNLGTNAKAGTGSVFVIEADEYDYMFLGLSPQLAVITNVEHDHPDMFPTPEVFHQAFLDFADRLAPDGKLLFCGDDAGAVRLAAEVGEEYETFSYSLDDSQAHYQARNLQRDDRGGLRFDLYKAGKAAPEIAGVALQVPGRHNVQNALAALAVADLLDLPLAEAGSALAEFRGSGRRFEVRGEFAGVTVIDDYAHHPTEIRATLQAARERYPHQTLWAVWQPHTFSRTRTLRESFAASFEDADRVLVTKVFPAREPIPPDFSAQEIVDAMGHPAAHFIPELADVTDFLLDNLNSGDVVLVLTAGDAIQVSAQLAEGLA